MVRSSPETWSFAEKLRLIKADDALAGLLDGPFELGDEPQAPWRAASNAEAVCTDERLINFQNAAERRAAWRYRRLCEGIGLGEWAGENLHDQGGD